MTATTPEPRVVGKSVPRLDGASKVTGAARYVDDVVTPGALHGKTVRSTIARGRIRAVHFDPVIPWDQFTIVTAKDIPGDNIVVLIESDQPILADGVINHAEEPILLIAHEDRGMAEKALRHIRIEYDEEPPVLTIGPGAKQKEYLIEYGDLEKEMAAADLVIERTWRTGAQEHVYIEPNGVIAEWRSGSVLVRGSLQCPYYVHKGMVAAFDLEQDKVEVLQDITGGGFGGKEEYPTILALHAALLSRKAGGRPVRLIYDRMEDMAASTKRHPSESRVRIGVMRDGAIRALDFDFRIDGGAYVTLSPVVLSRGVLHAAGVYRWTAARIHGVSHHTNSPPYGAFRGFGAPQSIFALEAHMSLLADELGLDPAEFRRRNFLHKGDRMPTEQVMEVEPNLDALLDRALELSDYHRKRAEWKRGSGRGIGLSVFCHGAGFTGSGEVYLASIAAVQTRADGRVSILTSNTDIGQGTETIFTQMAAEALDLPIAFIHFEQPDTLKVPNSGPTVASRTTMVVGRLVQRAAEQLREKLGGMSVIEHVAKHGVTRCDAKYEPPPGVHFDDRRYKGAAYGTYAWSVDVADVSVDAVTAEIKVHQVVSTVDIGTVINPVLAIGQVEGGIAQGVGWAMMEDVKLRNGVMANHHMTNYIIPTTMDIPKIIVEFIPSPYPFGAYGSKGVGELPMDGPAPAITAAVSHATGREVTEVPILPEKLLS